MKEKSISSPGQSAVEKSNSAESVTFNNAQWYVMCSEPKSHKKGRGGPAKRWGHTTLVKDNQLLIYGGNGRNPKNVRHWQCVYELDLVDWEWSKLESENRPPAIRDSHSSLLVGNSVYVYGGSDGVSKKSDELMRYDLSNNSWESVNVEGDKPSGREGHTACILQNRYMVVYGGWGPSEDILTDVHCYDIERNRWSVVNKRSGPDPKPRESQASCAIGDYIYIFGGQGDNETINDFNYEVYLNDLFRFKLEVEDNKFYSVWEELKPTGPKPTKRSSASVCTYKDRYFFIIGGEGYSKEFDEESVLGSNPKKQRDVLKKNQRNSDDENMMLFPKSDVWYYDTELDIWNKVKIKNATDFLPHFAHTSNIYEDFIIIFGGLSNDYNTPIGDICILSLTGVDPFKYTKSMKKRKQKDTEDFASLSKEEPSGTSQPPVSGHVKTHAPLCTLCKNKLNGAYNAITATQHASKIFEPKLEETGRSKSKASLLTKNGPVITGAFVHMLSQTIGWPFAAVGLLLDNSMLMGASNLFITFITKPPQITTNKKQAILDDIKDESAAKEEPIKSEESEREKTSVDQTMSYLELRDDGAAWTPEEFVDLIADYDAVLDEELSVLQRHTLNRNHSQNNTGGKVEDEKSEKIEDEKQLPSPIKKQYALNLKLGGFRLGNTIVIYTRNNRHSSLGLLSVQKMTNLHMPTCNSFLSVCWDSTSNEYKTVNGEKTKQLILAEIKDFISEVALQDMGDKGYGTKVLILNLKRLPIAKREVQRMCYEYELMSVKNKQGEIEDLQIRTLDGELKRKLQLDSSSPMLEFSLMSYLRLFFLDPYVSEPQENSSRRGPFDVHFNNKKVDFIKVKQTIDAEREQCQERFISISKNKMFEGIAGCNYTKGTAFTILCLIQSCIESKGTIEAEGPPKIGGKQPPNQIVLTVSSRSEHAKTGSTFVL